MRVLLGLGSNLGSRASFLRTAAARLAQAPEVTGVRPSPVWQTAPLGPAQPPYLNAALEIDTPLSPEGLLALTQGVETDLGRTRDARWGPRTLDIDLLWCDRGRWSSAGLTIPHPGLRDRAFALDPLLALDPGLHDPEGVPYAVHRAALAPAACAPEPWTDRGFGRLPEPAGGLWVAGRDEADGLAAAAEALGTLGGAPGVVRLRQRAEVWAEISAGADATARLEGWLAAVGRALVEGGLTLGRAVVTVADATAVQGVLWGEARAVGAETPQGFQTVQARGTAGSWGATLRP